MNWERRFGGREWKVTEYGVVSRNPETLVEEAHRTDGQPLTVTRYHDSWRAVIEKIAEEENVPKSIILATLATENGAARMRNGQPIIRPPRKEPGYESDQETPHRISVGPCHVLISTARAAMRDDDIDREWLLDLENNLRASFRFLAQQDNRWGHGFDPILASAVYNSGGLHDASNPESRFFNRWHLRSYGNHLDRFADWYGDACFILKDEIEEPEDDDEDDQDSRPSLLDGVELQPPGPLEVRSKPLPFGLGEKQEPLHPERIRRALRSEGFSLDDIRRIARAIEPLWAEAIQQLPWYSLVKRGLLWVHGIWQALRAPPED